MWRLAAARLEALLPLYLLLRQVLVLAAAVEFDAHHVILTPEREMEVYTKREMLDDIVKKTELPK